jgi:phosphonate transport system substrate-binding protein
MIRKTLTALGLCAVAALAAPSATTAQQMKELNFGIISTESTQNLKNVWDPFLADMSKKLGLKVNAYFAPDYAGIIQGMRFDKVDIAWHGNKSAMEAVDRAKGEVFVQTVDAAGNPGYWSVLLAHKDHPLAQFEPAKSGGVDFDPNTYKGCEPCMNLFYQKMGEYSLGNGDPNSMSGFLVPSYYVFAMKNVDAKKSFKRMITANHETNALAVINKQVDVATNNTESLDRIKANFPDKYKELRTIWISPLIAADPLVWRKDLPENVKTQIKAFFLNYGVKGADVENEKKILAGLRWAPFKDSSNKQLIPTRQIELYRDKARIEASESPAAEKAKSIAEIDAKLAALSKEAMTN